MMRRNEAKSASRGTLCVCVCHSRNSLCLCVCVFTLMTHKARCIQEKRKGGGNFCHIRCRPFKCIRMTFETLQWFEAWNGQFPPLLSVKTTTEFRTFLRRTKIENFNHCFFFLLFFHKTEEVQGPHLFPYLMDDLPGCEYDGVRRGREHTGLR